MRPTSSWSPSGAIRRRPSPSPRCARPMNIPMRSSSSWRPITSSATPKASRKPAGSRRSRRLDGHIMTFGIAPTFPATSYGYIAKGAALDKEGGLQGRALHREARCQCRREIHRPRISVERRLFSVRPAGHACRARPLRARNSRGGDLRACRRQHRSRFHPFGQGGVRARTEDLHRLRGDRKDTARRRPAGILFLVGRGKLGRGLECGRRR